MLFPTCPFFRTIQRHAPNVALYYVLSLKFKSSLLVKRIFFFFLKAAFGMAIIDLISRLHLASFVMLQK